MKRIFIISDNIPFGDDGSATHPIKHLLCPNCGEGSLHIAKVSESSDVRGHDQLKPDIVLRFWCECCDADLHFCMEEYKGYLLVNWQYILFESEKDTANGNATKVSAADTGHSGRHLAGD
jgi:hypothetical protein